MLPLSDRSEDSSKSMKHCSAAKMIKALSLGILLTTVVSARSQEVVWSQEFNEPEIDAKTWIHDVGGFAYGGFGNGQFEYTTSRAKNSYTDNGDLVIKAFRESYFGSSFTSARLNTQGRFSFKYGTLEAKIKMPNTANGLWPAFWLLGINFPGIDWPNCGEVDIVELGSKEGIAEGMQQERFNVALHFSNALDEKESYVVWDDAPEDLSLGYHLYKISWTPSEMTFYLDGKEVATWDITAPFMREFHQHTFPIVNLAIGGWPDTYTGVTDPSGVTALPTEGSSAEMRVDWIRLYDNGHTEILLAEDTAETGGFGIFTETTPVDDSLVYGDDTSPDWPYSDEAALYLWNNMTEAAVPVTPSEGTEVWSFDIGGGAWWGCGVYLPNFRNMENYSDGFLYFDIATTLTDPIKIGVKTSRGGESWQLVGEENSPLGFARDGAWHTVRVPLNGFVNTDFHTLQQIFMIVADSASASTTLSIDNVYYEPSVARTKPSGGDFGVYTETAAHGTAGDFEVGPDGEIFVWGETLVPEPQNPYEGEESLSFSSAPGLSWFGLAFTPAVKYNLIAADAPNAKLHFALKTSADTTFYIGMKSGNVIGPDGPWGGNTGPAGLGQVWIKFAPGNDPYGFIRDGNWHALEIPMTDLVKDTNLAEVGQLFQILGVDGPISGFELDDIYYSGLKAFETKVVESTSEEGVGLSWTSTDGSVYTVQWADELTSDTVWYDLGSPVTGDWSIQTVFDSFDGDPSKVYRIKEWK